MPTQACEQCAKRKVRCDKQEPCSNCKRRKQDRCNYPETSQIDRIKKLEKLVRHLGGKPEDEIGLDSHLHQTLASPSTTLSPHESSTPIITSSKRSKDPVLIDEDGQQHYLESRAWLVNSHRESENRSAKNALLPGNTPSAFQNIFGTKQYDNKTLIIQFRDKAHILWSMFRERVHPFIHISYDWELERLQSLVTSSTNLEDVDDTQLALVSAIYMASIVSLKDSECRAKFDQSRSFLLSECQAQCEKALAKTNILCMKNIVVLKAMVIYLMAGMDRLNTHSLWSLMGLAVRNGEKLGIHRDGTLLGLSPIETEERRRLWWQLQWLDLILAIRLGATPLTLMADWDVELPLNIEDSDLLPAAKTFPQERRGLTSMSSCLFTFYIIYQQRKYHADKGRFELSWSTNQSISMQVKEAFIDQLENGLNETFLKYCDPIRPLHVLLQANARSLICVFRQRILMTVTEKSDHSDHAKLLGLSMQMLEYTINVHTHRLLRDFEWLTANGFPWPSFMVVLVEASHQIDTDKCIHIWTLLSDLYTACHFLFETRDDRRKRYAAELVISAWKTCQTKGIIDQSLKPKFVSSLEKRSTELMTESTQVSNEKDVNNEEQGIRIDQENLQSLPNDPDIGGILELDFQDIDWNFWNSFD